MANKLALAASVIMLIAISGAAVAGSPKMHARTHWSAASYAAQAAYYPYAFEPAAPWLAYWPNVRRYQGGPKSDY
ncbi:hypothetical protein AAFX91_20555 [Bradyrhizobium sp. 31Argb]|uniref:hypothetical protein n=1 Tax=Bradyrhizobium sp. 31Argb TaxID=3141247 RepID=UPI003747D645